MSPSVIHRLCQQFLTTDSESRRFSPGRSGATTSTDDRCLSLCVRSNRTILQVNPDSPSLQAPEDWYQGQTCIEGFMNVIFTRGDQPFAFRSRHTIGRNFCLSMSTYPPDV
ncbi:hypothetical protein TNCV_2996841 [Trichonephila clavipes]|nr:hypothetical protein TNCV_2996841 [Trichonephila clavipes]